MVDLRSARRHDTAAAICFLKHVAAAQFIVSGALPGYQA